MKTLDEVGKWYGGVLGGSKPKRRRKNPAKFERCVREVKASAKKRGYPLKSAYAVCNASMRKNPIPFLRAAKLRAGDRVEWRPRDEVTSHYAGMLKPGDGGVIKHDPKGRIRTIRGVNKIAVRFDRGVQGLVDIRDLELGTPGRRNPHHHRDHHTDSRSYHDFGIHHAAGEIAEDVVRHGYSEGWHGKRSEIERVEKLLKPFGIIYADELRGAWGTTRRNPNVTVKGLTATQKKAVLAFVKSLKRQSAAPWGMPIAKPAGRSGTAWTPPRIGARVVFGRALGRDRHGVVERINARSITVRTDDGKKWRVPPKFFRNHPDHKALQAQKASRRRSRRRRGEYSDGEDWG